MNWAQWMRSALMAALESDEDGTDFAASGGGEPSAETVDAARAAQDEPSVVVAIVVSDAASERHRVELTGARRQAALALIGGDQPDWRGRQYPTVEAARAAAAEQDRRDAAAGLEPIPGMGFPGNLPDNSKENA